MTLNAHHDNLVLAAPRPVRLAAPIPYPNFHSTLLQRPQSKATTIHFVSSPSDAFEKLKLADDVQQQQDDDTRSDFSPPERDLQTSPRASPRLTPPAEAVEEFLSILRPAALRFPPTSPILRPSNGLVHGFMQYRRPPSCSLSSSLSNEGLGVTLLDQTDNGSKENEMVSYPFKLLGTGPLASPVSRTLTRNPFPRQMVPENTLSAFITEHHSTPSPHSTDVSPVSALSPAAVPLPLPTPDEMELESVS